MTEKTEESPNRYPLPVGIKTDRAFPRLVASTLIVLWVVVFYTGTNALAKRNSNAASQINETLRLGDSWWGFRFGDRAKPCFGYIHTALTGKETLRLALDGRFQFRLREQALGVQLTMKSNFNRLRVLEDFELRADVGNAEFTLRSLTKEETKIFGRFHSPSLSKVFSLPRPSPIFLFEKSSGQFQPHFPSKMFNTSQAEQALSLSVLSPVDIIEESEDSFARCREQVHGPLLAETFDLTNFLPLINLGSDAQFLKDIQAHD